MRGVGGPTVKPPRKRAGGSRDDDARDAGAIGTLGSAARTTASSPISIGPSGASLASPAGGDLISFLPDPMAFAAREQSELIGHALSMPVPLTVEHHGHRTPTANVAVFSAQALATDRDSGVHSGTRFEIEARDPPRMSMNLMFTDELPLVGSTVEYDVVVRYTRALVYVSGDGDQLQVAIDGWLGFTASQWAGIGLWPTESGTFAALLDKRATAGSASVSVTAHGRIGELTSVHTSAAASLRAQYEEGAAQLMSSFGVTASLGAEPDPRAGFLAPQAAIAQQHDAADAFLHWVLAATEQKMIAQLDVEFPKDLARLKSLLLEEYIDGDDERAIIAIIRTWSEHRDVLHASGRSYFDEFLTALKHSTWARDYGLWSGSSTSYYTSLFEETEEKAGEITSLIATSSREFGDYVPAWDLEAQGRAPNPELTKQTASRVLDALKGYTSDNDEHLIVGTMTGLPGPTQRAVLQDIMSRYDEREYLVFGKYGEAWGGGMLYWLFEDLDADDRTTLSKDLVAKGVLDADMAAVLVGGRGWGGKYLPFTTRKAQEGAQFFAEKANEGHWWAYPLGVACSLWLPETAGTTVATITAARVLPGLARLHPYIATGLLTTGTFLSSYELGIHAQELATGKDPYTGRELTREEMIQSALLGVSSALFLGAGFASAPGVQRQLFDARGPQFELPPGFEVGQTELPAFTPRGQRMSTPFGEKGAQYVRAPNGEVFEIRGQAAGDRFTVTRLSTGQKLTIGRDGVIIPGPAGALPPNAQSIADAMAAVTTPAAGGGPGMSMVPTTGGGLGPLAAPAVGFTPYAPPTGLAPFGPTTMIVPSPTTMLAPSPSSTTLVTPDRTQELSELAALITMANASNADRQRVIHALRTPTGQPRGSLEGYVLDTALAENQRALRDIADLLRRKPPDVIVGMDRGGALLVEVIAAINPTLAPTIKRIPMHRASDGSRSKFDVAKTQAEFQAMIDAGAKRFVLVDTYMGGRTARELRDVVLKPLAKDGVEFEMHWLREQLGFEGGPSAGLTARRGLNSQTHAVRFAVGDDLEIAFTPGAIEPITIFRRDGTIAKVISPPAGRTTRDVLIELLSQAPP